jgi:putative MFS transporter
MDIQHKALTSGMVTARLDRLPMTRHMWKLLFLVAMGELFETYDLYFTGYIAPALFHDKLLTATTTSFFSMTGLAGFLAAVFLGLFIGTIVFGFLADRFGRRSIFTGALLWYSAATLILAFQHTSMGLNLWRMIGGIGIGVEIVTIDSYVSELTPRNARGKAFGLILGVAQFCAPVIALLAWILVPIAPFGISGWRWIVVIGSFGALLAWWLRRELPESPRWLAQQGRLTEAESVVCAIEAKVRAEYGKELPPPGEAAVEDDRAGKFLEMFGPEYRTRTIMMMVVNFFQTIGYYGFASWIPTLLIAKGIFVTRSLQYTFLIVLVYPIAPFVVMLVADRFERKWQLAMAAASVAIIGCIFATLSVPAWIIVVGCLQTLALNWMATMVHAYQAELFPTRIRARAVGFVYSWSRLSSIFVGFFIAFFLRDFGVPGVFAFIGTAMGIVALAVCAFGPRSTGLALEKTAH